MRMAGHEGPPDLLRGLCGGGFFRLLGGGFLDRRLARALGWLAGLDGVGFLELHHRRRETADAVLVKVDDRVVLVEEPDRTGPVLGLRDPVANRVTSHGLPPHQAVKHDNSQLPKRQLPRKIGSWELEVGRLNWIYQRGSLDRKSVV